MTLRYQATFRRHGASILAILAGALTPLIFAPFNVWILAFLVPPAFWALTLPHPPGLAFRRGWLFGAGFFLAGVSWVYGSMRTVEAPVPLALMLTVAFGVALGLLFAVQAWLPAWWLQRRRQPARAINRPAVLLALAALWTLFEIIRSTLFTGLPWLLWGTLGTQALLRGWLPILGVFGLSLLILITAAALFAVLRRTPRSIPWFLVAAIVLFGGGSGLDRLAHTRPVAEQTLDAAVIQGNISQREKWRPEQLMPSLEQYRSLSDEYPSVDLIVWPETAITAYPQQVRAFLDELEAVLAERRQGLVAGLPLQDERRYYNGLKGFGRAQGEYHKQHLVPFGEYIPLAPLVSPLMDAFNLPLSGFRPGHSEQASLTLETRTGEELRLATLICYEAAYPALIRAQARDAGVLVVISNDAWFGQSLAPAQHLQITRARAIENRRPLVRATQTGLSVITDPRGRILAAAPADTATGTSARITPQQGRTPYQRWGEVPVYGLLVLLFLPVFRGQRGKA